MAYWRRSAPQMQAATESVAVAPPAAVPVKPAKSPRSRMMRQYDLVERVKSYNPDTDEDLLNRAYVYAMKAAIRWHIGAAVPGRCRPRPIRPRWRFLPLPLRRRPSRSGRPVRA